jgi:hypothetical protein
VTLRSLQVAAAWRAWQLPTFAQCWRGGGVMPEQRLINPLQSSEACANKKRHLDLCYRSEIAVRLLQKICCFSHSYMHLW